MDYNNLLLDYNNLLLDYNNLLQDYNNPIIIYYYYKPWININPSCPVTRSGRYERIDMHSFHADMIKSTIFAIMSEALKFPGN